MNQCRSRPKLSENFECHWSIPISGEIHMDQSLVHTFSSLLKRGCANSVVGLELAERSLRGCWEEFSEASLSYFSRKR